MCLILAMVWSTTYASEGLPDELVYQCHAIAINETLTSACAKKHAHLSSRADATLSAWKTRNEGKAVIYAKECEEKFSSMGGNDEERRLFKTILEKEKVEFLRDAKWRIDTEGSAFCEMVISKIAKDNAFALGKGFSK